METPTVKTYQLTAGNGRPIRNATKVVLPDGREIAFTERMSKRDVLKQALERDATANRSIFYCEPCRIKNDWPEAPRTLLRTVRVVRQQHAGTSDEQETLSRRGQTVKGETEIRQRLKETLEHPMYPAYGLNAEAATLRWVLDE